MDNYNGDNGSLFDEMLSDPDESFLFGGGDIWQCEAPTEWFDPSDKQEVDESFLGL